MVVLPYMEGTPNHDFIGKAVIAVNGAEAYFNGFRKKAVGSALSSTTFFTFSKVFLKIKSVH